MSLFVLQSAHVGDSPQQQHASKGYKEYPGQTDFDSEVNKSGSKDDQNWLAVPESNRARTYLLSDGLHLPNVDANHVQ